jgi:hypothetical protein
MNIDTAKAMFKNYLESGGYAAATITCYSAFIGYFLDYLRKINITDLKMVTHALSEITNSWSPTWILRRKRRPCG